MRARMPASVWRMDGPTTLAAGSDARGRATFGGLVPSTAVARSAATAVAALGVEFHADGAIVPLLVLSDNAGPLAAEVGSGVTVGDDRGTVYRVAECAQHPGLGSLQLDVWITPVPPADAQVLHVSVDGLTRTAITRRGDAVARVLSEGPWQLDVALVPARTAVAVPPEPPAAAAPVPAARVPARAFATFEGLVPVGQARVTDDLGLCLWAVERYRDRAVLSLAVLAPVARGRTPMASEPGSVSMWDDRGRHYEVAPVHSSVRAGWSETSLEITPAIGADVRALGVRIADPGHDGPAEYVFGIAVPEPGAG